MSFKAYSVIVDVPFEGKTLEESAKEFLEGFDFSECEVEDEEIEYAQYICTHNGVSMYYDYGGDYYFFRPQ